MKNRFVPGAVVAVIVGLGALTNGCSDNPVTGGLCCKDFKVGADLTGVDFGVDASIKGQFEVFAQAGADFSAAAAAALDDVGRLAARRVADDPQAAAVHNRPMAEMPPPIKADVTFRCKDNRDRKSVV